MSDAPNTLFLRLEGPLQAWGDNSKFVIRRTMEAPTKSGVIGMLCAALGISRAQAAMDSRLRGSDKGRDRNPSRPLSTLAALRMGVRIDRPGTRWWDYHTVGGGGGPLRPLPKGSSMAYQVGLLQADGKGIEGIKKTASTGDIEPLVTRREYLCDASFLVALKGDPALVGKLKAALDNPKWTLYLGRKCCPPSLPILEREPIKYCSRLREALASVRWRPRFRGESPPAMLDCLLDLEPGNEDATAQEKALVWYDLPKSFDPPVHEARLVIPETLNVGAEVEAKLDDPVLRHTPAPQRLRTDYGESTWGKIRDKRREKDHYLCVFCKCEAKPGQHVTYRHASKQDNLAALADENVMRAHLETVRSLCTLCHDAVTMIEYGLGMGLDRINPEEPKWRDRIIQKRQEIIDFRSLETRRRRLTGEFAKEVE